MPPEISAQTWQNMRRVLLASNDPPDTLSSLKPSIDYLRQIFPETRFTLLTTHPAAAITSQFSDLEGISLEEWGVVGKADNEDFSVVHFGDSCTKLIQALSDRQYEAAIIFTAPKQSPYALAYLCYLANIPIRVGQSVEFGGSVLSQCIKPPLDPVSLEEYHLHLLKSACIHGDSRQ